MFGMRCDSCGEVRWSLLDRADKPGACPACGAKMVEERRHPGRTRRFAAERRDRPTALRPTVSTR